MRERTKYFALVVECLVAWAILPQCRLVAFVNVGDRAELSDLAPKNLDPIVRDRFLKEARSAQANLQASTRNLQVRVHQLDTLRTRNKTRSIDRQWLVCVGDDPSKVLVFQEGKKKSISAANGRYSFQVHQASADVPYQLDKGVATEPGSYDNPLASLGLQTSFGLLESAARIWWVPLEYILNNSGFKLIAAESHDAETGQEVVKIAYRYEGKPIPHPGCYPGAIYWAELLPSRSWIVLRSGVINLTGDEGRVANIRTSLKYQTGLNGDPFPAEFVLEVADAKTNELFDVRTTRLEQPVALTRPDDEFYLPHYGISEATVPEIHAQWLSIRATLIMGGMVGILLALAIFLVARRARRVASARTPS